jgi:hypothetical protein
MGKASDCLVLLLIAAPNLLFLLLRSMLER